MLQGSVTLVTGGASGLGKATVELLVQKGGRVVLCDLPGSKGDEIAKLLGEDRCVFVPTDVVEEVDVQNALAITKSKFGKLNYVVNCAGVTLISDTYNFDTNVPHSLEVFNKVIQVNLFGTFNVIRLAVGLIAQNEPTEDGQKGVIVNTASVNAYGSFKGRTAYAASKAGVVGMTLTMAREFATQGIRVCGISPGYFDTPMSQNMAEEDMIPFPSTCFPQRSGYPVEFATLVQTIIENPMINGHSIRLDGGF